ncbi:hydrogenase maturation nickel metallochaperone HypA [Geobacter sp.]|uniref:hydrogenase maturation nickel metallochaperone HypA n=1 Tax=Geobacter sp. TaxID=46610 RepID=UPI00263194EB|nr:hydrogenase maturation nickel metallochaperone HypA [Geobacter sp.]
MHEMSITQSVVEICEKNAEGRRVLAVTLEIGELSGVVAEAVEFCFEACIRDTLLEDARLTIERVPGRGECPACRASFPLKTYFDPCPSCGAYGVRVTAGEELRVKELEVE